MSLQESLTISLKYGRQGHFSCEMHSPRVAVYRPGPRPRDAAEATRQALANPIQYPTLDKALIQEDRVVLALERNVPQAPAIVNEIWKFLSRCEIDPANVSIIQPADLIARSEPDPRSLLPDEIKQKISWKIHDPTDAQSIALLTNASTGERISLARDVIDAGLVIPVGLTRYDPILGYRGGASVFYPGLSTVDAMRLSVGLGHSELSPREIRPRRMFVDEVAWLMGVQFAVHAISSDGAGVCEILAGGTEATHHKSKERLDHHWLVSLSERVSTVVVAVTHDAEGHGWYQLGRAIEVARQLVESHGKIIVLSELSEEPGAGVSVLKDGEFPEEHLQALRSAAPLDLIPATQLIHALGWSRVYLRSRLNASLVEDLQMAPLSSDREVERLVADEESVAFIGSAQHAHGMVD